MVVTGLGGKRELRRFGNGEALVRHGLRQAACNT